MNDHDVFVGHRHALIGCTSSAETMLTNYLKALETEAITILREVAAACEKPVLLYSIGKDSSVLLHLARKAFFPGKIPFPVLHVDTTWKFQDMITHRDRMAAEYGFNLLLHTNEDGITNNITPFTATSVVYNDVMKTQGLRQALARWSFTAAIGGARRDEEKSRAKERVFSIRSKNQRWDPKAQRPEFWNQYNTQLGEGETMRVFPLSNWTERDIWHYIYAETIPIVPLYYAKERPVVRRNGAMIMVDDDRFVYEDGETVEHRKVRFRSLGCYPYTGAIESDAETLADILVEMEDAKTSERQGRLIDTDQAGSMEKKKLEGYF